mmetsp:Transcript_14083/g.25146  ORF Transcript_14083/g.25146 Transcript_14083/m.25146 type:complete len:92 (+) Transcript_14083:912-1187(+)
MVELVPYKKGLDSQRKWSPPTCEFVAGPKASLGSSCLKDAMHICEPTNTAETALLGDMALGTHVRVHTSTHCGLSSDRCVGTYMRAHEHIP